MGSEDKVEFLVFLETHYIEHNIPKKYWSEITRTHYVLNSPSKYCSNSSWNVFVEDLLADMDKTKLYRHIVYLTSGFELEEGRGYPQLAEFLSLVDHINPELIFDVVYPKLSGLLVGLSRSCLEETFIKRFFNANNMEEIYAAIFTMDKTRLFYFEDPKITQNKNKKKVSVFLCPNCNKKYILKKNDH